MTHPINPLEALLDSWLRHNTILLNLLRALPEGGLEARIVKIHHYGKTIHSDQ